MHLFAGAGGGLLADLILGHKPIVAVEWEPYACQVLRERAAEGWFPGLRVWEGDVRLFDPSEYAGSVDCIHAGFPCQPFSVAGSRKGAQDERGELFAEVVRCIEAVRPKYVFLENVPGLLTSRTPSCVCGWPYRRGGVHSHSEAIKQANLHRGSAVGDDEQSNSDSGRADKDIRWEFLRHGIQEREVGEAVAMAYQWGKGLRLVEENPAVPSAEETAGDSCFEPKRDEEEGWMDAGDSRCCGEHETEDARPKQEGDRCPECGGGLVSDESRFVWYMESVVATLAALGYDSEWLCLRASDCGANHHRDRWWLLADSGKHRCGDGQVQYLHRQRQPSPDAGNDGAEAIVADAEKLQRNGSDDHAGISVEHGSLSEFGNDGGAETVADASGLNEQGQQPCIADAQERGGSICRQAGPCGNGKRWWAVEPDVGRVADGVPDRVHRLKALGNAQVPLQAATAWRLLGGE